MRDGGRSGRGRCPRPSRRRAPTVRPPRLQLRRACGENGFIEDYTTEVRGRPLGAVHLITFDAGGRAQHYRR